MRVGFISYWFERGQAYVTRALIDAIPDHETFILARSPGADMTKSDGEWAYPNLSAYPEYAIPPDVLLEWISDNHIGIVFFNEEYDFDLVKAVKDIGAKTVGIYYWELFNPAWARVANEVFDTIICPTLCCFEKFSKLGMENIEYVPWGVDLSVFKPIEREPNEKIRFFHPAGWGGMHGRRGTQAVVEAFKQMDNPDAELLIHTQQGSGVPDEGNIKIVHGTVSRESLISMYQGSDVAVLPSKWEGIGLTLLEALACGLPVITVDAPPMNEFVKNGYNGFCIKGEVTWYPDIFVPGYHIDIEDMAGAMDYLACGDAAFNFGADVFVHTLNELDWSENGTHFKAIIDRLAGEMKVETKQAIESIGELVEYECSAPVDDRQYARYDKILADVALTGDVLEIGCKHGTLALMIGEKRYGAGLDGVKIGRQKLTGIDQSAENIEICRQAREAKGFRPDKVRFHQASIDSLSFPDSSFDTIIMSKVLEHIEHPEDLSEVVRVLKPTGTIIVVTNLGYAHWDPDHKWFFMPKETRELLKYGWFFKVFPMGDNVVAFEDFIEQYFGLSCGYQVYNEHESEHNSLEIYCHIYGAEAEFHAFPELRGETVLSEMFLSRYETREKIKQQ